MSENDTTRSACVVLIACLVAGSLALEQPSSRIINGQHAQPNQFPWHAAVQGTQFNSQGTLCGGALISQNFVLTAAHCLFGTNFNYFTVQFGSTNLSRPILTLEVNPNVNNNRILHPQYNSNTNINDLGLLRLPINIQTSFIISPIRLPALSQGSNAFTNATATFSGFGRVANNSPLSQALRFTEARVIPLAQCVQVFGNNVANANTLCTVGREFDVQGPCANDNGGPLVIYEQNNVPTLIAVQSFSSTQGCIAGQPAGFTRLGSYIQWISQNAGIPTRN